METMTQTAPYPTALADLVERCSYRPGWRLALADVERDGENHDGEANGLTLVVTTLGYDTYHPERGQTYPVNHYFPVPAATYNQRSWQWWLFKQLLLVEQHECMEFFQIRVDAAGPDDLCGVCDHPATLHDGRTSVCRGEGCVTGHRFSPSNPRYERPYAPMHGPGNDPYLITVERTDIDTRTSFRGEVQE